MAHGDRPPTGKALGQPSNPSILDHSVGKTMDNVGVAERITFPFWPVPLIGVNAYGKIAMLTR